MTYFGSRHYEWQMSVVLVLERMGSSSLPLGFDIKDTFSILSTRLLVFDLLLQFSQGLLA